MEVSKEKSASQRACLWARLLDQDKSPRCWWYPSSIRRNNVLRMSTEEQLAYQKAMEPAHEKFSETIRLAMLSLLGFALFCLLITFSAPDVSLLVAEPTIKMPFADVQVSFQSFVILAPLLLIVITLYLHIFYGYWLDLETDYQHLMQGYESSTPSIERLPTLFSLDHMVPRLLTTFIFYWLVPIVLLMMSWKAAARVEWGMPLVLFTCFVTCTLIFLQIRRRPVPQRWLNRSLWLVMGLIVSCLATITVWLIVSLLQHREMVIVPHLFPRSLNIFRADLKEKWLAAVDLRYADADYANFENANLNHADLSGADLRMANLQEANLVGANLREAFLVGANLQKADLWRANLREAFLVGANLQEADLRKAKLQKATLLVANLQKADLGDADLRDVRGFEPAQIHTAFWNEETQWPEGFEPPCLVHRPPERCKWLDIWSDKSFTPLFLNPEDHKTQLGLLPVLHYSAEGWILDHIVKPDS